MNIFKSKISQAEESLINLQETYDILNNQFATLQENLKDAEQLASTYKGEFERVDAENKELKEQLVKKDEEVVEIVSESIEVDELASTKAIEIIAQAGHEQVEVLEDDTIEAVDIASQMKKLKGQELVEFYKNNREQIKQNFKR